MADPVLDLPQIVQIIFFEGNAFMAASGATLKFAAVCLPAIQRLSAPTLGGAGDPPGL